MCCSRCSVVASCRNSLPHTGQMFSSSYSYALEDGAAGTGGLESVGLEEVEEVGACAGELRCLEEEWSFL